MKWVVVSVYGILYVFDDDLALLWIRVCIRCRLWRNRRVNNKSQFSGFFILHIYNHFKQQNLYSGDFLNALFCLINLRIKLFALNFFTYCPLKKNYVHYYDDLSFSKIYSWRCSDKCKLFELGKAILEHKHTGISVLMFINTGITRFILFF